MSNDGSAPQAGVPRRAARPGRARRIGSVAVPSRAPDEVGTAIEADAAFDDRPGAAPAPDAAAPDAASIGMIDATADAPAGADTAVAPDPVSGPAIADPAIAEPLAGLTESELERVLAGEVATPLHEVGCIDSYGYARTAGAWIAIGWVPALPSTIQECDIVMHFARAGVAGRCFRAPFFRGDLPGTCEGVIILSDCGGRNLGPLICIELRHGSDDVRLFSTESVEQLPDAQITARTRSILTGAPRDTASLAIARALSRPDFTGRSTLHELGCPIHMAVDEVIRCGDAGIVLIGWFAAEEDAARRLQLRVGQLAVDIPLATAIRVRRDDVSASIAAQYGIVEQHAGFVVFVPDVATAGAELDEHAHIQVETSDLSVGYVTLPPAKLRGLPAMRRILETFSLRYEDMTRAYDRVVGPAIAGLNQDRLRSRVGAAAFTFGRPVATPTCSVIVPLYGRIDFMEYQLALFSREPMNRGHEFIYVLDDPNMKTETLGLAETCFARFGLPFRVLVLDRNVGYAPANNAGLRIARGSHVCFLNSDVFPGEDRWIDALVARLADDPGLGAVGPVLLFEDSTVQHRGLEYEPLTEFGDWHFPMHPGKGMRLPRRGGLVAARAITGACMMMSRALAEELGGFDERFVIGDFEDSDLCLRIDSLGLECAVDLDCRLYHLERQSQGNMANAWRFNLTLYNAWVHEHRWGRGLELAAATPPSGPLPGTSPARLRAAGAPAGQDQVRRRMHA